MSVQRVELLKPYPNVICIFSGKRKSGKDFVVEKLKSLIGSDLCEIIRLSAPLKQEYARIHGLDFEKLLDASSYKEKYRKDMIRWGEGKREKDPSYFCSLAAKSTYIKDGTGDPVTKPIWFISDARRASDIQYFNAHYPSVLHVRIEASIPIRRSRGWLFSSGVDDAESECGLDDERFDFVVINDNDDKQLMETLKIVYDEIRRKSNYLE